MSARAISYARHRLVAVAFTVLSSSALAGCACDAPSPSLDAGLDAAPLDAAADASPVDAAADTATPDTGPRPMAPLEGELSFAGCTPDAADVHVRVRAVSAVFAPTEGGAAPPPAVVVSAVVSATADPRVFSFRIDDLVSGDLYQVGAEVDDPTCGELGWRGPRAGLVMAGAAPARFDGLVRNTRLEVLGARPGGDTWVSRDFVRSDETMRRFRWRTELPGVTAYDLQFATERFDLDALSAAVGCAPPAGLLHSRRVTHAAAAPNEVDIDLATVLAEPPPTADPLVRARWEQVRYRHAPIYVRAVPSTATDDLCDPTVFGVSSWVELVITLPEETPPMVGGEPVRLTGTYHHGEGPWPEPQEGAICWTTVTEHRLPWLTEPLGANDAISWSMVLLNFHPPGYVMMPNESFCYLPPTGGGSSSFFDDVVEGFTNFVTGLVDAISQAVDAIAALYEAVKAIAVDIVSYALASTVGCPAWCHTLVQMAAEYALVAMGLPPTLPNFDQLVDQGVDYLAAEVAAQTGVPASVVSDAITIAGDMIERAKATRGGSSGGLGWAVEDTGFRPSTVVFDVARGSPIGTPGTLLLVRGSGPWISVLANLHTPGPGEPAITMPLVLYPDLEGIAPPAPILPEIPPYIPAYYGHPERVRSYYQQHWFNAHVVHSCVAMRADALGEDTFGLPVYIGPYADLTRFNTPGAFSDPFGHACTP